MVTALGSCAFNFLLLTLLLFSGTSQTEVDCTGGVCELPHISSPMSRVTTGRLRQLVRQLFPPLTMSSHKGQAGKVAVIGGCSEYTGAPFYAGMSALRCGADLVTVICTSDAAGPIKSYSPELMVTGALRTEEVAYKEAGLSPERFHLNSRSFPTLHARSDPVPDAKWTEHRAKVVNSSVESVVKLLPRFSSIVIGPGLGRDALVMETVARIIREIQQLRIPLVLDGDALWLVAHHPELVHGHTNTILTPNAMEFRRLWAGVFRSQWMDTSDSSSVTLEKPPNLIPFNFDPFELTGDFRVPAALYSAQEREEEKQGVSASKFVKEDSENQLFAEATPDQVAQLNSARLAQELGGVTILRKGRIDVVSNGKQAVFVMQKGAPRRCGGQGDVLAGLTGLLHSWAGASESKSTSDSAPQQLAPSLLAVSGTDVRMAEALRAYTDRNQKRTEVYVDHRHHRFYQSESSHIRG